MANMLNFTAEKILNLEFGTDFKGYSSDQVDHMLDLVIEDYQTYDSVIEKLTQQAAALQKENESLRQQLLEEEGKERARKDADPLLAASSNVDILKRLSRLERQVFDDKNRQ